MPVYPGALKWPVLDSQEPGATSGKIVQENLFWEG
jgi:hypothetical protein